MFELLAAVLEGKEITVYVIHQFPTLDECIIASVKMAQQFTEQTATFICAKGI